MNAVLYRSKLYELIPGLLICQLTGCLYFLASYWSNWATMPSIDSFWWFLVFTSALVCKFWHELTSMGILYHFCFHVLFFTVWFSLRTYFDSLSWFVLTAQYDGTCRVARCRDYSSELSVMSSFGGYLFFNLYETEAALYS